MAEKDYCLRFLSLATNITTYGVGTYTRETAERIASTMNANDPATEVSAVPVSGLPGGNTLVYTSPDGTQLVPKGNDE